MTLRNEWRRIRKSRDCALCCRHHDCGAVMQYAVQAGARFQAAYFCFDCLGDIPEGDRPGGEPPTPNFDH